MSYNFLRTARSVTNSLQCRYDTLNGYSTDLSVNGDFNGWDQYNNVYLYGSWNGTLFGTSYDRSCYIGRTDVFSYIGAEYYYIVQIMMKVTNNNSDKVVGGMTTGRIRWRTLNDTTWDSSKQQDFDLIVDNKWHLYQVNMGPNSYWQGDINDMRVYPFIDGWEGDQFAIKYIRISSVDHWICTNTQCSYYSQYEHNCPGAGARASIEAGNSYQSYTTVSGIDDELIVNINGYGDVKFNLGTNTNLDGIEMSKVITTKIGSLNVGSYVYAQAEYDEYDKLKITSGTTGTDSSISIPYSAAAETLGFYDADEKDISTYTDGADQATGFDYTSSRIFTPYELNKLMDGYIDEVAYEHDPLQFNVEGGRRDFANIGNSRLISDIVGSDYYESLNNKQRTIIDVSHPINNNGRLKSIQIFGKIEDSTTARVKICRPLKDGTFKVVYSLTFDSKLSDTVYTAHPLTYKIDCDILVERGDLIGVFNADLYVGVSLTGLPDAAFYQYDGEASGIFDPGRLYSFGVAGLAIYARSDRLQTNASLEIDIGNRVNVEQIDIYGAEEASYFEFNLASCADVSWAVNLYGESHIHSGVNMITMLGWTATHTNIAYGVECLDDMLTTPDNGQCGDTWGTDNGIATYGTHSYFYVNGDAEWGYSGDPSVIAEFHYPNILQHTSAYVTDPISFTLLFPNDKKTTIHKSIIYFKEENNFRDFELSYYLGDRSVLGNAYKDISFKRVPEYTSIRLDGLLYDSSNKDIIEDYLFQNPTSARPIYDGNKIQNPNTVKIANSLYWNILEHNFDEVECGGFRVYTNYHNSTKIMEMEVYSKVPTDPSLLDNVVLSFSDYGDTWKSVSFDEVDSNKVSAFIGGSPRYFKIELESTNVFNINEIDFLLNDHLKLSDCGDSILLNNAKTNAVENATPLELTNIYDKPFDLIVDLPHEVSENNGLVFWSKLNSQSDIENPDVGPPCFLYKEDNYDILNDDMQCAINIPSYGLKNLIDGKTGYYSYDEGLSWTSSGTLSSGVALDFSCKNYARLKAAATFSGVSSKYWQFDICLGGYITLDLLEVFYSDAEVEYTNLRSDYTAPYYIPVIKDDITNLLINSTWTEYQSQVGDNLNLFFDHIDAVSYGTGNGGPYIETILSSDLTDFSVGYNFMLYRTGNHMLGSIRLDCYDVGGSLIISVLVGDFWTYNSNTQLNTYERGVGKGTVMVDIYNDGVNTNKLFLQRSGSNLIVELDDVTKFTSSDFDTTPIHKIDIRLLRNAGYTVPDKTAVYFGKSFRFDLASSESLNNIRLKYLSRLSDYIQCYTSVDGISYTKWDDLSFLYNNTTFYDYFAIDLERRHILDFVRNYGDATGKLLLDDTVVNYSNTESSNPNDVVWTSDKTDARWVRFSILSGDGTYRYLRKIGIYPDISINTCYGGGYNCDWHALGTILSDYPVSQNVAYGATVTGTNNYVDNWTPDYAVDGIYNSADKNDCWGFQIEDGIDPYLEIDFGQSYNINKVVLYHGCDDTDTTFLNTDYTIGISSTISGAFTSIVTISSNTELYREHEFDTVNARRLRLTISDYDSGQLRLVDSDGKVIPFNGSFLREIEVYTDSETGYVDSETWPIVCTYLNQPFLLTNHELININNAPANSDWDNSETFFKYADSIYTDPQKVSFVRTGSYVDYYYNSNSSNNQIGNVEYLFDREQFFSAGIYKLTWEAYDVDSDDEISIRFEGPQIVDAYAETLGASVWASQNNLITIPIDGFYDVKGVQHLNYTDYWGVRYPLVQKIQGETTWVAVKRNTATNYSYDDDSDKYGIDYLNNIKIYGDRKYRPTEYSWWWDSTISTLSNDSINTKVGSRSLKIAYPTSSGVDTISVIEGSEFGQDALWSPKDRLQFWWKIDDVSKLDTSFGYVRFGNFYNNKAFYYEWYINDLNLNTGWNLINLGFDDYGVVSPAINSYLENPYLDSALDLKNNNIDLKSFNIAYRGKGNSFTMNIDDIHIDRNTFDDAVHFGKGLCLTGNESLFVPVSGITLEKGATEFWLKTYYDSYGRDAFNNISSKTLFTMTNNNNDIISIGLKAGEWFEALSGNLRTNLNKFETSYANLEGDNYIERDEVIHLALAWSNNSEFMDNDNTMRLFLNGVLIYASSVQWSVGDSKDVNIKFGGGNTQLAYNDRSGGSGIFENVKVYNYCKTDFNPYVRGIEKDTIYTPNQFLEISVDNINFYGVDSDQLPFIFEQVPAGDSETIYLRTNKNDNFKRSKKTSSLVVKWLTTV